MILATGSGSGWAAGPTKDRDAYSRFASRTPGDASRGLLVFADSASAGCLRCHRVGDEGGDVGPDLSDVGRKLGREHLIESVLEPSRLIVEGYRSVVVATRDGRLWTGRIFINDVGEARWEEVNEGPAGSNYGWPAVEGPSDDPRYRAPILAYKAASIAGGAFCPDRARPAFPSPYRAKYFFMDFVKGWIKVLDPSRPVEPAEFASGLNRPVDLAFSPDGSLYVLQRDAWVIDDKFRPHTGSLLKIRFANPADDREDTATSR